MSTGGATAPTSSPQFSTNNSSDNGSVNLKRTGAVGGGSKKQKIAFGFKGMKLSKSTAGGAGAGIGSGGGGSSGGSGDSGAGGLNLGKNKRLLQDVSKWNARKMEVSVLQGKLVQNRKCFGYGVQDFRRTDHRCHEVLWMCSRRISKRLSIASPISRIVDQRQGRILSSLIQSTG